MGGTDSLCVRSDKRGAHNLLKLHCCDGSSEVKDTIVVRVYYSRGETGSLFRPDRTGALACKVLIIMAWSLAPYIHVILADVVSIT